MADTGNYQKIFPTRLRETMARLKMTQAELGEKITPPKSRQSISAYCDGKNAPDWEVAASIAKALGVSLDWLCGLEKQAVPEITAYQWLCYLEKLTHNPPRTQRTAEGIDGDSFSHYWGPLLEIDSFSGQMEDGFQVSFLGSEMADFYRKYEQLMRIEDIDDDIVRELKEKLFHKYELYFTPGYRNPEVLGDDLPF